MKRRAWFLIAAATLVATAVVTLYWSRPGTLADCRKVQLWLTNQALMNDNKYPTDEALVRREVARITHGRVFVVRYQPGQLSWQPGEDTRIELIVLKMRFREGYQFFYMNGDGEWKAAMESAGTQEGDNTKRASRHPD